MEQKADMESPTYGQTGVWRCLEFRKNGGSHSVLLKLLVTVNRVAVLVPTTVLAFQHYQDIQVASWRECL